MTKNALFHAHMANIKAKTEALEEAVKEFKEGWRAAGGSRLNDLSVMESISVTDAKGSIAIILSKWQWPF